MRVEAIKVAEGFLIPFGDALPKLPQEKIVLNIEIVEPLPPEAGYSALDQLVGLCDTQVSTASVEHDQRIYHR